jgi:hypothetical protein
MKRKNQKKFTFFKKILLLNSYACVLKMTGPASVLSNLEPLFPVIEKTIGCKLDRKPAEIAILLHQMKNNHVPFHIYFIEGSFIDLLPLNVAPKIQKSSMIVYGYSHVGFIVNQTALETNKLPLPKTFQDLLSTSYQRRIGLQDPRTSTLGMLFLLSTQTQYAHAWRFFKRLLHSLSASWTQSFSQFTNHNLDIIWSDLSSLTLKSYQTHCYSLMIDPTIMHYEAVILQKSQNPIEEQALIQLKHLLENDTFRAQLAALLFLYPTQTTGIESKNIPKKREIENALMTWESNINPFF